jgi:DNA-binding XRE family transcriptional regulator
MDSEKDRARRAEFADHVVELRDRAGWTQAQLGQNMAEEASRLGRPIPPVSRQTVYSYEHRRRFPEPFYGVLLCRVFRKPPEALALEGIVTPRAITQILAATVAERGLEPGAEILTATDPTVAFAGLTDIRTSPDLDWERLGATLHCVRPVDGRVVEDQWTITRRLLADRRFLLARTTLDLLADHVVRLRQLRGMATDDRLRRELGIMIGQSAIVAGQLWMGRGDFGSATAAFGYAVELAGEMRDGSLRTTGLISQAQIYGNPLPAAPRQWPPKVLKLMAEAEASAQRDGPPAGRVWLHASRSSLHAVLGNELEAGRELELARQAEALTTPGSDIFFANTDQSFLRIVEARFALLNQPVRAIELLQGALRRTEVAAVPIRAWFATVLAGACVELEEVGLAGPALSDAILLARSVDGPLLAHSAERLARQELATHGDHPAIKVLEEHLRDVRRPA